MRADLVVVGAGVVGAAVALEALRVRPNDVVVLVDGHRPVIGASAYSAGILRHHHTYLPDVELAARSISAYDEWQRRGLDIGIGKSGFLLLLPRVREDALRANLDASPTLRRVCEVLDVAELRTRFPALDVNLDDIGSYEVTGGHGDARATTVALRQAVAARGGIVATGRQVEALGQPGAGRWRLETNLGPLESRAVVLAAGPATPALLEPLGRPLPVQPKRIGLVSVRLPKNVDLPVCIDDVTGTYVVPQGDRLLVGVRARPEDDQLIPARPLEEVEAQEALERGQARLPFLAGATIVGSQAASDGYTPDGRPVIGEIWPGSRLFVASGFSGGGFKTAPEVARQVVGLLTEDGTADLAHHYAPDRFERGRRCAGAHTYAHL